MRSELSLWIPIEVRKILKTHNYMCVCVFAKYVRYSGVSQELYCCGGFRLPSGSTKSLILRIQRNNDVISCRTNYMYFEVIDLFIVL
jgi:hypothetical protein